jgi:ketol-acid reductoisomerase
MKQILTDIQEGAFARNWLLENQVGRPYFNAKKRIEKESLLEKTGEKLRSLMSWLKK